MRPEVVGKENIANTVCDLTVVILTLNEERHIARCIHSVLAIAKHVIVVDSGSRDATCTIARKVGAQVLVHPFTSHGAQFNWALANGAIQTEWVMKLDADEYITEDLASAMAGTLITAPEHVHGFTVNLRRIFFGKWLRHGSLYPIRLLRIWRFGQGRCEERRMDEHVIVQGQVGHIDADFADDNLNSITWWTDKHNRYASREAIEILLRKHGQMDELSQNLGRQAAIKRWIKQNIYAQIPLGARAFLYFIYRYFIRLGFLDGWPGFVFHFLQAWWYRMLVDVKIYELENAMRTRGVTLQEASREILMEDLL